MEDNAVYQIKGVVVGIQSIDTVTFSSSISLHYL